jgi:hypothetical protein
MSQDNTKQARRGARSGVRNAVEAGDPAGMPKTARKHRSRDATLGGMNQTDSAPHPRFGKSNPPPGWSGCTLSTMSDEKFLRQAHAPAPETAQERIAKIKATAAVQIAQAAAGQPTKWTVIREVTQWLLARLGQMLDQADQLPPLS